MKTKKNHNQKKLHTQVTDYHRKDRKMEITLKFKNLFLALAGRAYGEHVYKEQIEPYKYHDNITLVFPEHIHVITSSFAGGLLGKQVEKWGYDKVKAKYQIKNEELAKQIWEALK